MAEIILSIAIPTFNRCESLKEELDSLLPQLSNYKDMVEVVISDNASPDTDCTEEMVYELDKKYGITIDYKKLPSSIYFEDNFKEVVDRTHGRYVLMTGDDDLFAPNYIETLFGLIKNNYGLIHFNRLIGNDVCKETKVFDNNPSCMFYEGDTSDFIRLVMRAPGFMSSLVFRRDCWDAGKPYEKENYYGYHFLGRLYQGAVSLNTKSCYYYMPMLIERKVSHDWGTMFPLFFFVGYSNIFTDLDHSIPGIKERWLEYLHNDKPIEKYNILIAILKDKAFYSEKKYEFYEYLTPGQKKAYNYLLCTRLPQSVVIKLYKIALRFCCYFNIL